MKYFKNVNTLEVLKKYHPDNANGSTEATQEINTEYDKLFKVLKDKHESTSTGSKESEYSNNMYLSHKNTTQKYLHPFHIVWHALITILQPVSNAHCMTG